MATKLNKTGKVNAEKVTADSIPTVEVPIHYEKSNLFRVIHADGVIGNILPSGRAMNVAFYSERLPFPKTDVYDIGPNGHMITPRPGAAQKRIGFYREIEMSAVMDWETAKSLSDWLNQVWPILKSVSDRTRQQDAGKDKDAASSGDVQPGSDVQSINASAACAGVKTNVNRRSRSK